MKLQGYVHLAVVMVCLGVVSGCAITNKFGPYMGKVIDADTKAPIEGAVVYMECYTGVPSFAGVTGYYADSTEVLTDEKGEFHIELRATAFKPGHVWDYAYPDITIFKPGYGVFPRHKEANVDILLPDTSHWFPKNTYVTISLPKLITREERVRNLRGINVDSRAPKEKWKELFRLRNIESIEVGLKPYKSSNETEKDSRGVGK